MKSFQIFLVFSLFNVPISAQNNSSEISGVYEMRIDVTNALIIDTLTLNSDGTFVFHEYDKHEKGIPPERNNYGKGSWRIEKNVILFSVNKNDLDTKHTLNFNNSKARFISKYPRDKSDREIRTSIKFYDSEIFWIKGRALIKINPETKRNHPSCLQSAHLRW